MFWETLDGVKRGEVVLGDLEHAGDLFGLEPHAETGANIGTHSYLAPEAWAKKGHTSASGSPSSSVNQYAVDVFALGISMLALLTDKVVFEQPDTDDKQFVLIAGEDGSVEKWLEASGESTTLSAGIRDLINKMTRFNPTER